MKFRRTKHIAWRILAGKAYIVDTDASVLHELNEVGTVIWQALDTPSTVGQIVKRVTAEFDVTEEQAAADTRAFLTALSSAKVVEHA